MRHSETDWNRLKLLQGQTNIPLNDYGRKIAQETAEGLKSVKFTKAIVSPLDRAVETAHIILQYHKDTPLELDPRIMEISFGAFEGFDRMKGDKEDKAHQEIKNFFKHPDQYTAPGDGESIMDLCARTKPFIWECIDTYKDTDETILIVAHGATIRSIMVNLFDTPLKDFWLGKGTRNCETFILEADANGVRILDNGSIYYTA